MGQATRQHTVHILDPEASVICPHCGSNQEDPAKHFIVPNRPPAESKSTDKCFDCDRSFTAELTPDGKIRIA